MKNFLQISIGLTACFLACSCQNQSEKQVTNQDSSKDKQMGLEEQVAFGEHLLTITGCHDCHTPKKMGPMGPELDMDRALSGHPSQQPVPNLDRLELESKGVAASQGATVWVGPWGVSFASNLTSDVTGIGNWTEEQFFIALREGKSKGIPTNRMMLPPMPYEMFRHMTDEEIKAIFAYLKSTRPVDNVVPAPMPPLSSSSQ